MQFIHFNSYFASFFRFQVKKRCTISKRLFFRKKTFFKFLVNIWNLLLVKFSVCTYAVPNWHSYSGRFWILFERFWFSIYFDQNNKNYSLDFYAVSLICYTLTFVNLHLLKKTLTALIPSFPSDYRILEIRMSYYTFTYLSIFRFPLKINKRQSYEAEFQNFLQYTSILY